MNIKMESWWKSWEQKGVESKPQMQKWKECAALTFKYLQKPKIINDILWVKKQTFTSIILQRLGFLMLIYWTHINLSSVNAPIYCICYLVLRSCLQMTIHLFWHLWIHHVLLSCCLCGFSSLQPHAVFTNRYQAQLKTLCSVCSCSLKNCNAQSRWKRSETRECSGSLLAATEA